MLKINMEETNPKKSAVKIVGIIVVGIIILAAVFQKNFLPPEETISVTSRGSVPVKLDGAIINLGVATIKAATPEEALKQTSEKIEKIKGVFLEMQIPEKDWQITGYAFDPQFENASTEGQNNPRSEIKGYNGFQRITVKLSGVDKDPKLVDNFIERMVKEGANKVGVVKFVASNIDALKKEAREKSVQAAKEKALALEKILGIKLKGVSSLSENEVAVPGEIDQYYYDNNPISFANSTDQVTANPSINSRAEVIMETTLDYHFR
jgi:uncharacterized protein YggE